MVSPFEDSKSPPARFALQLPVLKRHLERGFHGRGAVICVENPPKSRARKQARELQGQEDGRVVAGAEEGGVFEFCNLAAHGLDDARMAVAVDVRPDGRISVEIFAASRIFEDGPAAFHNYQRLMSRVAPRLHLGEWVPEILAVGRRKLLRTHASRSDDVTDCRGRDANSCACPTTRSGVSSKR